MANLPVITSFGGINAAGRSSGFQAYRRLVFDQLGQNEQLGVLQNLAALTGQLQQQGQQWCDAAGNAVELNSYLQQLRPGLLEGTLIRKLEQACFDADNIPLHRQATLSPAHDSPLQFTLRRKDLPASIPASWQLADAAESGRVTVTVTEPMSVMFRDFRESDVKCAGQLPSGFDPSQCYNSRNHPRALQMTVFGASDAIQSLGIEWEEVRDRVAPDQISVYAGSCLSQLDYNGNGGMLQARLLGNRVTSKQLPLGLNEMAADFINAYLLGNLGSTGHTNGACATFLYNLRQGIRDIQSGSHRIAIIGSSESSLVPEVFDAFATMGALASDDSLRALDKLAADAEPDYRRACRPFAQNSGFTVAESAQFIVLFDDALAMETGASVYGSINDVFINADGHKKSITGPGLGNYLTMAKAAAATRNIIGQQGLEKASFVQAHGTGTPQNRVSEAAIVNKVAQSFGIEQWPVAAIKSYLGHSIASAAGDQIMASLGVWKDGILPGILTTHELADDVESSNLDFLLAHKQVGAESMEAAIINSKGFGGNNASASILAPHITRQMLEKRHGREAMQAYEARNTSVQKAIDEYSESTSRGENRAIYRFDYNVLGDEALSMDDRGIQIDTRKNGISLELNNPYADMC
jgi:acetoacetyl-[acyl-carrier protein] synthase